MASKLLIGLLASLIAGIVITDGAVAQSGPPNVVIIITDDHRADSVDSLHGPQPASAVMPNALARIAAEGVRFEHAFAQNPSCGPARASFLSGWHSHASGVPRNETAATFDSADTLATWLSAAGYYTALLGKYVNGLPEEVVAPGWDTWFVSEGAGYFDYKIYDQGIRVDYGSAEEDYRTDVIFGKAADVIATAPEPFFLTVAPIAPHDPSEPAPRHVGSFGALGPFRPESHNEPDTSDKPSHLPGVRSAGWVAAMDAGRVRHLETLQAADEGIEAIIDALEARNVLDETLLVFTSDNGIFWGEHRLQGKKLPYEEAVRVPMIIRYPALAPLSRTETRLVGLLDLTATIVELSGAVPGHALDGESLVPLLDESASSWRSQILLEGEKGGLWWAGVREADWKYIEYASGERELYDLATDPLELENLAGDPSQAGREAQLATDLLALRPGWLDLDGDQVPDDVDVCPTTFDPFQLDADADGAGDACEAACADGRDNDADGKIDYPDDPDCSNLDDDREGANYCGLGWELSLVLVLFGRLRRRRSKARA